MVALAGVSLVCLRAAGHERFPFPGVGRWHVDVQRAQRDPSGVVNLVMILLLDEKQHSLTEASTLSSNNRDAISGDHVEPLVGTEVPISSTSFRLPGGDYHFGGLRPPITEHHVKAGAEAKLLISHRSV
jgi:hypothetical protein